MSDNAALRKFIGYVVVFVLGFAACAWVLRSWYGGSGTTVINAGPPSHQTALPGAGGANPVADAAEIVEKYVVNIDTIGRPALRGGFGGFFGFGPPEEVVPKGKGSGVIISADGYIVTNNHVVADTSKVTVTLSDKKQYDARIIGRDSKTDLAVIKIDPKRKLEPAVPADSTKLRVGDWVIAVGSPLGLGSTVTVGVVSATARENLTIEGTTLERAIQTDAAINPGNSGGALADISGKLVGINTAIASTGPGGGSIGIGFAIPSDTAMTIAREIIKNGKVVRPWIGIMYEPLTDELRQQLRQQGAANLPSASGVIIRQVVPGSPADHAGLLPLDVITRINGKKVDNPRVIAQTVTKAKVGQIMDLDVWHARTGKTSKMALRLSEMPAEPNQ